MARISVVLPVYNNADEVPVAISKLECEMLNLGPNHVFEFIVVNDGSDFENSAKLRNLHQTNSSLKLFELSRNFGQHIALAFGYRHASGDAIIRINPDLEDSIISLNKMIGDVLSGSCDCAKAVFEKRKGTFGTLLLSGIYAKVIGLATNRKVSRSEGSLRVMSRRYIDSYNLMNESKRLPQGLDTWLGYTSKDYIIEHEYMSKKSSYTFRSKMKLGIEGLFYSSNKVLNWVAVAGFLLLAVSILGLALVLILKTFGSSVPGYLSLAFGILLIISIQSIFLGILGIYLGFIFDEVKRRPLYIGYEVERRV